MRAVVVCDCAGRAAGIGGQAGVAGMAVALSGDGVTDCKDRFGLGRAVKSDLVRA